MIMYIYIVENIRRVKTLTIHSPWPMHVLGDPEVTANLYCKFTYPYWEGCVNFQYIFAVTSGSPSI